MSSEYSAEQLYSAAVLLGNTKGGSSCRPIAAMVDYSRFDHIGSDSDDDDVTVAATGPNATAATVAATAATVAASALPSPGAMSAPSSRDGETRVPQTVGGRAGDNEQGGEEGSSIAQPVVMRASKKGKEGRIKFEYQGTSVYMLLMYDVDP